jgi:hypothetical protein
MLFGVPELGDEVNLGDSDVGCDDLGDSEDELWRS